MSAYVTVSPFVPIEGPDGRPMSNESWNGLLPVFRALLYLIVRKGHAMSNIRQISLIFLCVVTAFYFSFSNVDIARAQDKALEPVTIQLRWFHQFQFAGYYAAIEKGFYAAEGLQVSLRPFQPGQDRIAPVLKGNAQYGVGDPGLLALRNQGKPVVVLAQVFQHSPNVLMTRRGSGIFSADELAGKRVMMSVDESGSASIQAMILDAIGDLNRVTFIPHTYNDEKLINGDVDAMSGYLSNEPYRLKTKGLAINIIDLRSYGIDFYGDNLFTKEKEVNEHPERVDKMIRATIKGWVYALEHKDDIIDLILTKYNQDLNREQLRYEAKVIDQMIVPDLAPIGDINPRRYDRIAKTFHQLGMTTASSVPDGFIYATRPKPTVSLTTQERAWLAEHPKVRVALFDLPPAQFKKEGTFTGYQVEMLEAILQKVGLEPIYSFSSLAEVLKSLRDRNADIALDFIQTPERGQMVFFSEKTYNISMAIFGRENRTDLDSIDALKNKVIASYIGYGFEPTLKRHLPEARIVRADTPLGMLRLVASGKADAAVHEIASGEQMLQKNLIINVVNHGEFIAKSESRPKVSEYVVRKDLPHLMSILDKAYAALDDSEKQAIWNKWFAGKTPPKTDRSIVALTPEERQWLDAHPDIQLGYTATFEPEVIENPGGMYRGILVDILEELNRRLGTRIRLRVAPIPVLLKKAQKKETDGILNLLPGYADELGLLKTRGYMTGYAAVFGRRGAVFDSPTDLIGKRVAIIDGVKFTQLIVEQYGDGATILNVEDALEGLQLVDKGIADFFLGGSTNAWFLTKYQLFGLRLQYVFYDNPYRGGMAIRSDWPELVAILNKGLSSFSEEEIEAIVAKWIQLPVKAPVVTLTPEEKTWLEQNQTVRVRTADWPPYLIVKDNQPPQGIAIEYLKLIAERTGIRFDYDVTDRPFAEFLKDMKRRKGPDMSALIVPTLEREAFLSFSQTYIASPYIIFTREQDELLLDISGLSGKTLAIMRGSTVQDQLTRDFPEIRQLLFDSDEQALQALATGQAGAYIGNLTVASHIIQRRGFSGVRIAAPSPFGDQSLSMGNRNDWPELTSIIDKALASISEAEKTAIRKKYVALRYEQGINRAAALRWILIVVGGAFGIIAFVIFWNRSLASQVRNRTAELDRINQSLSVEVAERERAEKVVRASRDYLKNLTDSMPDAVFSVSMPDRKIEWASDTFNVLGYSATECVGRTTEFLYPDRQEYLAFGEALTDAIAEGKEVLHIDRTLRKKNGDIFPASVTMSVFRMDGQVSSITAIVRDITEQKEAEQEIQLYQKRLKALASQLTVAEERERRRIAADLHDQIGQTLALARLQLAQVRKSVPIDGLTAQIDELSDSMHQAAKDTQQLVFDLSSPLMNELGLAEAISEWLEEKIGKRYALKTKFSQTGGQIPLSDDERAILFRNVRELLTNVVKHARANLVQVSMEYTDVSLSIIIRDDGIGFDDRSLSPQGGIDGGFGLFSVRERMTDFGGTLEIASEPGKGCKATLTVPLRNDLG